MVDKIKTKEVLTERQLKAKEYFFDGYNCCQSVVLAFKDKINIDEESLKNLTLPFGGGIGRLREVCGAFSGAVMVLGLVFNTNCDGQKYSKAEQYSRVQEMSKIFIQDNGSVVCREILQLSKGADKPIPSERNQNYYDSRRKCVDSIISAVKIIEEYLNN